MSTTKKAAALTQIEKCGSDNESCGENGDRSGDKTNDRQGNSEDAPDIPHNLELAAQRGQQPHNEARQFAAAVNSVMGKEEDPVVKAGPTHREMGKIQKGKVTFKRMDQLPQRRERAPSKQHTGPFRLQDSVKQRMNNGESNGENEKGPKIPYSLDRAARPGDQQNDEVKDFATVVHSTVEDTKEMGPSDEELTQLQEMEKLRGYEENFKRMDQPPQRRKRAPLPPSTLR